MQPHARLARALARSFAFLVLAAAAPAVARAQSDGLPMYVPGPDVNVAADPATAVPSYGHPMYVAGPDMNITPDPAAPVARWPFGPRIFRCEHNPDWGLHAQQTPIPRTFSYYYTPWFNHPRHCKVVEPDGTIGWRTTVHGQPIGTPWPSYLVPNRPHHH